jgi:hypothetical protein
LSFFFPIKDFTSSFKPYKTVKLCMISAPIEITQTKHVVMTLVSLEDMESLPPSTIPSGAIIMVTLDAAQEIFTAILPDTLDIMFTIPGSSIKSSSITSTSGSMASIQWSFLDTGPGSGFRIALLEEVWTRTPWHRTSDDDGASPRSQCWT